MDDQKTAPSAGSGVLSLRERADAGWLQSFKAIPIGGYEEAIAPKNYVPGGFAAAPGDDGVWTLLSTSAGLLIFSRWLVRL